MISETCGLPSDEMLPILQEQGSCGGEKPSRAGPDRAIPDGPPVPEETKEEISPAHAREVEDFFADFPRPAERRAKEFLPQWLRRLGRG